MANHYQGLKRNAREEARIAWLRILPELNQIPSTRQDVDPVQSELLTRLAGEMQRAGFYARTTTTPDIRWGIRVLAERARRESQ